MKRLPYLVATLFAVAAVPLSLHLLVRALRDSPFRGLAPFAWLVGVLLALALALFTPAARWIYVLFHEAAHALLVLLFKGRIREIRVGSTGGHVQADRTGFLIRTAPYWLPLLLFTAFALEVIVLLWFRAFSPAHLGAATFGSKSFLAFAWAVVNWYNLRLLRTGTTDVDFEETWLSWAVALNAFLLGSALVFGPGFNDAWIREIPLPDFDRR